MFIYFNDTGVLYDKVHTLLLFSIVNTFNPYLI